MSLTPLYFMAYIGGLICWIPFFLKRELCEDVLTGGKSASFSHPAYVILGLSIPVTIHLFCDIITGTRIAAITRCYRLFSILIPCLIIICYAIPQGNEKVIYCVINSQSILLLSGFIIRSYTCGSDIWSKRPSLLILALWSIAIVAENFKAFTCNQKTRMYLNVIWGTSAAI